MSTLRKQWLFPPIYYLPAAFAVGITLQYFWSLPFWGIAAGCLTLLAMLGCVAQPKLFIPLSVLVFAALGAMNQARLERSAQEAPLFTQGSRVLEGKIVSMPELNTQGRQKTLSFVLETDQVRLLVFLHYPSMMMAAGDWVRLLGKIEAPKTARNPHVMDYAGWLRTKKIRQIFRCMGRSAIVAHRPNADRWSLPRLRSALAERFRELLPYPHSELANALILGLRKGIPRPIVDDFIKTGTAHILAISGLNIVLVGKLFHGQARFFGLGRQINLILTAAMIWGYTLLAGGDIPVLRAGIMGGLILMGLVFGHTENLKSAFFASLFALLLIQPDLLFQASFQLSFVAVASLLFLLPALHRPKPVDQEPARWDWVGDFFRDLWLSSAAVTLGLFPILIYYFHLFSLSGFVVNALAVPLSTAGIVSSFFAMAGDLIWHPLGQCLSLLPLVCFHAEWIITHWFARLSFGYLYFPAPNFWFFLIYYAVLLLWLWRRRARFLVGLIFLFAASGLFGKPAFELTFLDVGKSESVLLTTRSSKCLIQTGLGGRSDQVYWVIKPFLMGEGVGQLDGVLLAGERAESTDTLQRLREYVRIKRIWTGPEAVRIRRDLTFEPVLFSGAQVGAWKIHSGRHHILYVTSRSSALFRQLLADPAPAYDAVYLPHGPNQLSRDEMRFLVRKKTRYLISNQRGEAALPLKRQIERVSDTQVLSLQLMGAVRLREVKKHLISIR